MTGWHKSIRALFAAVMTTMLAVLMHVGAGGDFSALGTGFVFVLVLWAAMILAGRRLGYLALAAIPARRRRGRGTGGARRIPRRSSEIKSFE